MRVEITDAYGMPHVINSASPELIGRWFAERAEVLMSANCMFNHPVKMDIWPETDHERTVIGQHSVRPVNQEGLLELARHILNVSERLGEIEKRTGQ